MSLENFTYEEQRIPDAQPIYVNSSSLKLGACERRYALTVGGYNPPEEDDDDILLTGTALHKFAELFSLNGGDIADAVREAAKLYPTIPRATILKCGASRARCFIPPPIMVAGRPAVEFKFNIPWYTFQYEGKKYQLIICGTIDHLTFDKDQVVIYDYKSSRYRQAEYALKKYKRSSQFAFYQWVLYTFAAQLKLDMHYANAIREGRIGSRVVPILISATEPLWVVGPMRSLSPHQFADYRDHFVNLLLNTLLPALLQLTVHSDMPHASGMVNDACQYCKFANFCFARTEEEAAKVFKAFPRKEYNPTSKEEEENDN